MRRLGVAVLSMVLAATSAFGQAGTPSRRVIAGGSLPAACTSSTTAKDWFYKTGGSSGLYVCTAANTYTLQASSDTVSGPASSTDNAVARFDGATGRLLQNSVVTISDVGVVAGSSISLTTNTLTSTSLELKTAVSDETGAGALVFQSAPTLSGPVIADFTSAAHDHADADDGGQIAGATALSEGTSGTGAFVRTTAPAFVAGSGSGTYKPSGVLAQSTTEVATGADTTETDLFSYTMPANTLATNGDAVVIHVVITYGPNTNTKTVKIYLGGGAAATLNNVTTAPNNVTHTHTIRIHRLGSALQRRTHSGIVGSAAQDVRATGLSEDLTTALAIRVTGTNGTATAGDITGRTFSVIYEPAP